MRSYPEALVLEDDPTQLEKISKALRGLGMDVVEARSAVEAQRRLEQRTNTPVIAVVDWNMQLSPDRSVSIPTFLTWLRKFERDCHVIVYTIRPDLIVVKNTVTDADPLAHYQDKRLGVNALLSRLRAMTGVEVGDLALVGDTITCTHSGEHYFHETARRLMAAYPREVNCQRDEKLPRAVYRFKDWLKAQGSDVDVECMRHRLFRLVVKSPAGAVE